MSLKGSEGLPQLIGRLRIDNLKYLRPFPTTTTTNVFLFLPFPLLSLFFFGLFFNFLSVLISPLPFFFLMGDGDNYGLG